MNMSMNEMEAMRKVIYSMPVSLDGFIEGADGTIALLERAFGARVASADGKVMHAEVRVDDTVVMLADAVDGWPAVPAHVRIYVPDVDASFKRALEAGATSVQAPVKKDDDDKRGGVKDAGGTTWWIATRVA
jgi:uncharacterized glyoxalase superfamily protein PhnB